MKVRDLMTKAPITVQPSTSLKDVAGVLANCGISGVPVVDDLRVPVGVVSEADIVAMEAGAGAPRGPFAWLLDERAAPRLDARTAGEAMTSPAITIGGERSVYEAARTMVDRGVNRLPVVDADGRLTGILTRADLVRAFVRPDREIADELRDEVVLETLWVDPRDVEIEVVDGVVSIGGAVPTKADARLIEELVARVAGVVDVRSTLGWRVDAERLPQSDPRIPSAPRS